MGLLEDILKSQPKNANSEEVQGEALRKLRALASEKALSVEAAIIEVENASMWTSWHEEVSRLQMLVESAPHRFDPRKDIIADS